MVDRKPEWRDSCRHDLPAARRSKTPGNPRGHRIHRGGGIPAASPRARHRRATSPHFEETWPADRRCRWHPGTGTTGNGYSAPFVKYSYRGGQVVHYKLTGGDHGLRVGGSTVHADEARQIVAAFLLQ